LAPLNRGVLFILIPKGMDELKRLLNDKESSEAGFAVGTILAMAERLLNGDVNFTEEQLQQITKANEILSGFSFEEQIELLEIGLKGSVN
jgi:hypothetical protein